MNLCLKTYAKQAGFQTLRVRLDDRLPERISAPCDLVCVFKVEDYQRYYLLTLQVTGSMTITCQRCLGRFHQDYVHHSDLALCSNDDAADSLMAHFECVVVSDHQVSLTDVLIDELHLYAPEKHVHLADCDLEISGFIGASDEMLSTTLGL